MPEGEADTALVREIVVLSSATAVGARRYDAYCVRTDAPQAPAILLLPEMFGLTPAMRGSADMFAAHGHVVLAPNLFWRAKHPETLGYMGAERAIAEARLEAFDIERAMVDIGEAAAVLRQRAGTARIIAVGHCIGGRLAVLAMARLGLAGAISYYGLGLSRHPAEMRAIAAPVQLHYGLADPHVPVAEIEAVAALVAGNPLVSLYRYGGAGHSFVNPDRPMFDAALARQVMARSLDLIASAAADAE